MKLIQTDTAQVMGEYNETTVDAAKRSADILIIQVGPYVVDSKIELSGKGIVLMETPGRYMIVSELVMARLHRNYKVMSNF